MNEAPPAEALRKIIHVDMDAFYASVEQRDNPELSGKPVAVGGMTRGVVAAASYEARKFGIRSAMPSVTALRRCPDLIFVKPRFDAYREVSNQIRAIFPDYTPHVEPLSLDEAYLDVTEDLKGIGIATRIAEEIRARIRAETGLTASAGVSYNKFLAKLASDQNKPDGLCVVTPKQGPAFVAMLPVKRFHGVGPVTAAKMARLGIETGADLRAREHGLPRPPISAAAAHYYHDLARGICHRQVKADRPYKSVSAEDTFFEDLRDGGRPARRAGPDRRDRLAADRGQGSSPAGRSISRSNIRISRSSPAPASLDRNGARTAPNSSRSARPCSAALLPPVKAIRLLGLGLSNLGDSMEAGVEPAELELPLQLAGPV